MKLNLLRSAAETWRQFGAAEDQRVMVTRGFALGLGVGFAPLFGLKTRVRP